MMKEWTNKDNLELSIKELTKIVDVLENINLFTEFHKKENQKKVHEAYNLAFNLRSRLTKRLEKKDENME